MSKWLKRTNAAAILLVCTGVLLQLPVIQLASQGLRGERQEEPPSRVGAAAVAGSQPELQQCGEAAVLLHDVSWASACMLVAQEADARHADCLRDPLIMNNPQLGKAHCDQHRGAEDDSPECTLPLARAATLNASLKAAEDQCLAQAKAQK
jgi:hypothetical protein